MYIYIYIHVYISIYVYISACSNTMFPADKCGGINRALYFISFNRAL